eukprot:9377361-Pyramimonas_sp.AAC.1
MTDIDASHLPPRLLVSFAEVLGPSHAPPELNLLLLGFAPMFVAGGAIQDPEAGWPINIVADIQYLKESSNFDELQSMNIKWTAYLCLIM